MIIDLLNYSNYTLSAEASCLFTMQVNKIPVLPFFCVTPDTTEETVNQYLFNHFRYTKEFSIWLSLPDTENTATVPLFHNQGFHYEKILKSILYRYIQRILSESAAYLQEKGISSDNVQIIVQEWPDSDYFGKMETACHMGLLNETIVSLFQKDQTEDSMPYAIFCHTDDGVLYSYEPPTEQPLSRCLLRKIFSYGKRFEKIFKNSRLSAQFFLNEAQDNIFFFAVQKIAALDHPDQEIIHLSTEFIANYYPGIVTPLYANIAQSITRSIISVFLLEITGQQHIHPETTDLLCYTNGRLYLHTNHSQKVLDLLAPTFQMLSASPEHSSMSLKEKLRSHPLHAYKIRKKTKNLLQHNFQQHQKNKERFLNFLEESRQISLSDSPFQMHFSLFQNVLFELSNCLKMDFFYTMLIRRNEKLIRSLGNNDKKKMMLRLQNETARQYRIDMRSIHQQLRRYSHELAKSGGDILCKYHCIEQSEDIFFLTLEELSPMKDGKQLNFTKLVAERKQQFASFIQMPNFTNLLFYREIVEAPPMIITSLEMLFDQAKFLGCGISGDAATGKAIVLDADNLPVSILPNTIGVARKFNRKLLALPLAGLVLEEPAIFADIDAQALRCPFPVVVGVEHACTFVRNLTRITVDGSSGEVIMTQPDNC